MTAITLSRRRLLQGTAVAAASGVMPPSIHPAVAQPPIQLNTTTRILNVKGKPAKVLGLLQNNGLSGLFLDPGQLFNVELVNKLTEDTIIHWHGQTPPDVQDGVAITGIENAVAPGATQVYSFPARSGTYWMHSHQGLQEMQLLAGPLIVRTPEDVKQDAQEVTVMLHDFTFKAPEEVLEQLARGSMAGMDSGKPEKPASDSMAGMPAGGSVAGMGTGRSMAGMAASKPATGAQKPMQMGGGGKPDVNDFDFDAYLANDSTLDDPMVVRTERNGRVRLRIINGAASTIFWIDLGAVDGTLVAVDGDPVRPIRGRRFPIAEAQRLEILVDVPAGAVVPVLAQREGDRVRTGVILAAPGASVGKIAELAERPSEAMGISLESRLTAANPLKVRPVDRQLSVVLSGSMSPYRWWINGRGWEDREPLKVSKGQRVVFNIVNKTPMGHPMHLHGHAFQVVELNGKTIAGAVRDTLQIAPNGSAKIAFDADNPGRWLFHCHNMLHMETGMITEVVYDA
ncbi:MAG: hypothetical protein QOH05_2505 [Acetobacteraceae bacterium]|nr:hypothetical protein [Acetobacteraceae bacterium]